MMVIDNKFELGDIVYVATDREQIPGVVLEIVILTGNSIMYRVRNGDGTNGYYEIELSKSPNLLKHYFPY